MCGRYTLRKSEMELITMIATLRHIITPRYNIAPSQSIPVYRLNQNNTFECAEMRWGLVPHWSKEANPRYSTINARAESVRTKPAYRTPFQRQRCLIPADGWYEWQILGKQSKQPYFFHVGEDRLFFFAGIWDHWQDQQGGNSFDSCSIIVTEANEMVRPIHDRMPVIINAQDFDMWLDPNNTKTEQLETLLRPYEKNDLNSYPVSTRVNNPRFDEPECVHHM